MNSIEYIQGLRLTDDEKLYLHKNAITVNGLDYDTDIADAQYDKLLRGLVEILTNNPDEDESEGERQEAYRHFASILREVLEL